MNGFCQVDPHRRRDRMCRQARPYFQQAGFQIGDRPQEPGNPLHFRKGWLGFFQTDWGKSYCTCSDWMSKSSKDRSGVKLVTGWEDISTSRSRM